MPKCTCIGCKCNLNTKLEKRSEEERVHQFLMGLDELPYSTVRSNIIATDPLPNMYRVYSRVTEQERVKTMTKGVSKRSDPMSFTIKTGGMQFAGGDRKDEMPACSYCHKPGHSIDTCYKLHGYPEWWGAEQPGRGRGRNGQQGRRKGGATRINTAQVMGNTTKVAGLEDADKACLEDLSIEDWTTLNTLWNSHKSTSNARLFGKTKLQWIFNTGATHHMTGAIECFSNLKDIPPCPVWMPNGERVTAAKEGTVVLGKLLLKAVLLVPKINCNLISVSQLARDKE